MTIKYLILAVLALSYKYVTPLTKEINFLTTTQFFAASLYEDDKTVVASSLIVRDFYVLEDRLYIFPLDNKIVMPIDLFITHVDNGYIEVIDADCRYTIDNVNTRSKNLYQYVYANTELGTTLDYYVVSGKELERISSRLSIYYEKV